MELRASCLELLQGVEPVAKAARTRALAASMIDLTLDTGTAFAEPTGLPGRPPAPRLVPHVALAPRSPFTPAGRAALLHAVAHIEFNAINLALDAVWRFVIDPHQVVTCLPGAELQEVVDDHTFLGRVKVKVGAITTSYKGRIKFDEVDEDARAIRMVAEGRDAGGGTAKGTMTGRLRSLSQGQTEVVAEASVDLTGRIMQVGRGMIQGVSHQLFLQFVASTKARLEAQPAAAAGQPSAPIAPVEAKPIRAIPLLLRALMTAIAQFFRRLFGRRAP